MPFGIPWKLIGIGLAALFVIGVVFAGYRAYDNMQATIRVLTANNAKLETAVGLQTETITSLKGTVADRDARAEQFAAELYNLSVQQARNRDALDHLSSIFAKHDLEKLADAKPQLVEERVNRATRDLIRLLNAAGSPGDRDQARRGPAGAAPPPAAAAAAPAR